MAEASTFRGVIEWFGDIGIYDVVLPFLLIFTVVFAILEKSKILGLDKIGDKDVTKKNLNSMVAFVVAFLVVASTKVVAIINEALANIALMLVISISFLLLAGTFFGEKDEKDLFQFMGGFKWFFIITMLIATIMIFLWAIKTDDGTPWLEYAWNYLIDNFDTNVVGSIILVLVIIGFMWYIVRDPKAAKANE